MKLSRRKGFTLVEVMVAVAILSFGIVAVYQTFFVLIDAYERYSGFLDSDEWLQERIWEVEDALIRKSRAKLGRGTGTFTGEFGQYDWESTVRVIDIASGLFEAEFAATRSGKSGKFRISRISYVAW
ncbi:MAG: prepilin-type N-terminal cleavage/methylation domain-containing protein [Candidatus Omnitrophota bacterium]